MLAGCIACAPIHQDYCFVVMGCGPLCLLAAVPCCCFVLRRYTLRHAIL